MENGKSTGAFERNNKHAKVDTKTKRATQSAFAIPEFAMPKPLQGASAPAEHKGEGTEV